MAGDGHLSHKQADLKIRTRGFPDLSPDLPTPAVWESLFCSVRTTFWTESFSSVLIRSLTNITDNEVQGFDNAKVFSVVAKVEVSITTLPLKKT